MKHDSINWPIPISWQRKTKTLLELRVLHVLASYADMNGISYPTKKMIVQETLASERSIQRALSALERYGILRRFTRGGHLSSEYRLIKQSKTEIVPFYSIPKKKASPKSPIEVPRGWCDATHKRLTLPGIYAFYQDGKVVYIGSSVNVQARLRQHIKLAKGMKIKARYFTRKNFQWLAIEARLIHRLHPTLNTIHR